MSIFKRLLKIGQAEIHALVDKMEDPVSLTEQGIKDMKEELAEVTEEYVKARATVIRAENQLQDKKREAEVYKDKAKLLLERAERKEMELQKAEALALEALRLKKAALEDGLEIEQQIDAFTAAAKDIEKNLDVLKYNILKWEKELATLKAKQKINCATLFANKQMANLDSNSTIEMLERLKLKSAHDDSMREAYGDLAKIKIDQDIDFALHNEDEALRNELENLKKQIK